MKPIPALLAVTLAMAAPAQASAGWSGVHADTWLRPGGPALIAGGGPNYVAFDARTHTLYVANLDDDTVSVVDTAHCNARHNDDCAAHSPVIRTGSEPVGVAFDARTRTLYVANQLDHTVAAVDATRCNALDASGCDRRPALAPVAGDPFGLVIDEPSGTVYVGNLSTDTLALIDGTTCNRVVTTGCATPATLTTGPGPAFPGIDPSTRTVYVPNNGGDDPRTVSVLDARTCNARTPAACPASPPTLSAGSGVVTAAVDPTTRTLYVLSQYDATLSVFDATHCQGTDTSGCAQAPATSRVGPEPFASLILDRATHTLYVPNGEGNTVSVIDTAHCRAGDASGCGRRWPTLATGDVPGWIDADPATRTLYVPNILSDDVSILDVLSCNALRESGCRDEAPAIGLGDVRGVVVDPGAHTVYVAAPNRHALSMFDTTRCRARTPARCTVTTGLVPGISGPLAIAVDPGTRTLYATNRDDRTLVMIDTTRCRSGAPGGCRPVGPALATGAGPAAIAVDVRTHAVFVSNTDDQTVMRFDGSRCNARTQLGCGSPPATGAVGAGVRWMTVDPANGTLYAAELGGPAFDGHTVAVIDGDRCCTVRGRITVGRAPQGLRVDGPTLYVANQAYSEEPGTVSVVDTRRCHGRDTSGCGAAAPRVATGLGPIAIAIDPATHRVFTGDLSGSTASLIDGTACNALRTYGCARPTERAAVGFTPIDVAFDAESETLYVVTGHDQQVSLVDTSVGGHP